MSKKDLVIIGGGAAGLTIASGAAQLGLDVALVERQETLGGDCLHTGCVPSKSMLHAAKVASLMTEAEKFGLLSVKQIVDLGKVNDYVHSVIARIQPHDDPQRFRSYGCDVVFGTGHFINPNLIQIGERAIHSKRFVIATGSRPILPKPWQPFFQG